MSSKPNGIMISERPNSVRVRRQNTTHGVGEGPEGNLVMTGYQILLASVVDGIEDVEAEALKKLDGFSFVPGDMVRVTLLVEVVK